MALTFLKIWIRNLQCQQHLHGSGQISNIKQQQHQQQQQILNNLSVVIHIHFRHETVNLSLCWIVTQRPQQRSKLLGANISTFVL